MSLADLRALLDLAQGDPAALGSRAMLDAYHKARHWDVQARVSGIDALNRASMIGAPALRNLRAGALDALPAPGKGAVRSKGVAADFTGGAKRPSSASRTAGAPSNCSIVCLARCAAPM